MTRLPAPAYFLEICSVFPTTPRPLGPEGVEPSSLHLQINSPVSLGTTQEISSQAACDNE